MADNKDKKVLNVPALRFPEFTEEWNEYAIGKVLSIGNGRDYKHLHNGNIPVFGTGGYMTSVDDFLYDGESVFIGRKGTINKPLYYNGKFWTVDTLFYTHSFVNVLPKFVYCLFQTINWLKYNEASGVPSLSKATIEKIKVCIPSMDEQDKLSNLLFLLDKRIEVQNKIIEDLKKLKSAIVDKLYLSTKGKTYPFRELFEVVNERNKNNAYSNVLSASQELGMIERSDINIDIKFEQDSISRYKIVHKGDYVVHLRSFQGGFAFSDRTGICSPAYTILRPNDMVVYGYLSYFFTSKPFIKSLKLVTYGIRDGRSINVDEWLDMTVTLPTKQEQIHVLAIINAIDSKLRNETMIRSDLHRQKLCLLNSMFI
ncbi:restriction endonuclease subunit S [uncultured Alistipes sp.]|uniref:restriction endonuclease subunit S n=1 Tax=uncultured Alistipes sp. TaxID=538949 RepID=UPI0026168384|nr:restriction endonuclease subunit S [uncultured Alistipes sp.]